MPNFIHTNATFEEAIVTHLIGNGWYAGRSQFNKRALVDFTVNPDVVYLTTRLDGSNTRFLPFNNGFKNGAGNPPAKDYTSYGRIMILKVSKGVID